MTRDSAPEVGCEPCVEEDEASFTEGLELGSSAVIDEEEKGMESIEEGPEDPDSSCA